jgi:hypothetical protein
MIPLKGQCHEIFHLLYSIVKLLLQVPTHKPENNYYFSKYSEIYSIISLLHRCQGHQRSQGFYGSWIILLNIKWISLGNNIYS